MIGKTNVGGGGVRGIDYGEITLASKATSVTVSHKLGSVPSWVALIPKEELPSPSFGDTFTYANLNRNGLTSFSSGFMKSEVTNALSETEVTFNCYISKSTYEFPATDYYWFAIA